MHFKGSFVDLRESCLLLATLLDISQEVDLFSPWRATGVAGPSSPIQSTHPVCPIAAACSIDLACLQAEQREKSKGRIMVSETLQSHGGQPVICLVYTFAVRSQSTHHHLAHSAGCIQCILLFGNFVAADRAVGHWLTSPKKNQR